MASYECKLVLCFGVVLMAVLAITSAEDAQGVTPKISPAEKLLATADDLYKNLEETVFKLNAELGPKVQEQLAEVVKKAKSSLEEMKKNLVDALPVVFESSEDPAKKA